MKGHLDSRSIDSMRSAFDIFRNCHTNNTQIQNKCTDRRTEARNDGRMNRRGERFPWEQKERVHFGFFWVFFLSLGYLGDGVDEQKSHVTSVTSIYARKHLIILISLSYVELLRPLNTPLYLT